MRVTTVFICVVLYTPKGYDIYRSKCSYKEQDIRKSTSTRVGFIASNPQDMYRVFWWCLENVTYA